MAAPCKYDWPAPEKRKYIGKRIKRIDGGAKSSGQAKYSFDINRPGMLFAKVVRCPYAHAKITSIDTSAAEAMPGVKSVRVIQGAGKEIQWAGDEIAAVAAVSEEIAEDAARKIKVEYEQMPYLVNEEDLSAAQGYTKPAVTEKAGDPDKAFADPDVVTSEGYYGIPVITHCCLESHGQVTEWTDPDNLKVWASTQAVSVIGGQFAEGLGSQGVTVSPNNVNVICQYVGGGFGSKFAADRWGVEGAMLSKGAGGKAVKLLLERNSELMVAGSRPSAFAKVKVAAKKDGTLVAWQSESWGTGGIGGSGVPPIPYVFHDKFPNRARTHTFVSTNIGPSRAWRAPNHPQACLITLSAFEDLAAKLNMDPIEFLMKNADMAPNEVLARTYKEELKKAAELADWKKNWHPRGDKTKGHIKRGMGVSLHTWGGGPHAGKCQVTIQPDGSVEVKTGSQDLGTGTRTVINIVVAETMGLPLEAIKVSIGDSIYPADGGSGGSTTVGGVSGHTRRGAVNALDALFAAVAPSLGAPADQLEAVDGHVRVKGNPAKSLTWKQACAKLGVKPAQAEGEQGRNSPCKLNDSGVGGVQIADVSVDTETGIVKMNRMVAVQDCGLVIDVKTAESQVYGALIMGICYALYEEKIMDQQTGRMLNPNMEFYKLATIADIGDMTVHMMTGPGYDERGVIGLGEPPVISPGAAISNAVANAIGVRVPTLPLTPDKVLEAIEKGGMA
jgi:xanthine dehydrogenase YagR molybdenum-binding subunit